MTPSPVGFDHPHLANYRRPGILPSSPIGSSPPILPFSPLLPHFSRRLPRHQADQRRANRVNVMAPFLVCPDEVALRYGVHDQRGCPRYLITALGCGMCFTTEG